MCEGVRVCVVVMCEGVRVLTVAPLSPAEGLASFSRSLLLGRAWGAGPGSSRAGRGSTPRDLPSSAGGQTPPHRGGDD